jgi:hypothetical protein
MSPTDQPALRKRVMGKASTVVASESTHFKEIDLQAHATIHYSSEDPAHPIERIMDGCSGRGASHWASARPNVTEEILLEFDEPQHIVHLAYEVEERDLERTQEVRIEVSSDGGQSYRQILVQEYNFSPRGSTYECETLGLDLRDTTHLRLIIVPNKSGSGTATLTSLRLFS